MQELSTASWDVRIYKRTFIITPDAVKQQYELSSSDKAATSSAAGHYLGLY